MGDKALETLLDGRTEDKDGDGPFTYRRLKEQLALMTEAQLDQEVQIMPNNPTPDPTRLQPVYGINTVECYCHVDGEVAQETRSAVDFQHHPEQVVMLSDYSPFSKDGDSFYTLEEEGFRGNKTGKLLKDHPLLGVDDGSQNGVDD